MWNVFVGVAARRHLTVDPFERSPAPAVVIRRAENQPSAGLQHTLELAEDRFVSGDMLDDLRTDDAVERRVLEGKLEDRAVYQGILVAARVAKLAEHDVQPDQPARVDNATRPAAHVERPLGAGSQLCALCVSVARPVA